MQDFTLSFWDAKDNFKFEKSFSTNQEKLQESIWYIEYCSQWITIDSKNRIHKWDLTNESYTSLPDNHNWRITDLVEIPGFKKVAIADLNKTIRMWDIGEGICVKEIILENVSVHTLSYATNFNVLMTAGFENEIGIWSFDNHFDINLCGKLVGHNTQVTALHVLYYIIYI